MISVVFCFLFFFFKQKTAYEMRISDWSSDVCSSDLVGAREGEGGVDLVAVQALLLRQRRVRPADVQSFRRHLEVLGQHDLRARGIEVDARGGFHRLADGLEADPAARVAADRKSTRLNSSH